MTAEDAADPLHDAVLAARLFALAPCTFGGMVLRGPSPARDALVTARGGWKTLTLVIGFSVSFGALLSRVAPMLMQSRL